MAREAGFLVSPNATQAVTSAWAAFRLAAVSAASVNSRAPGGSAYLTDLELDLDTVAGGATTIQAMLTYDSAGLSTVAGPTAATTFVTLSGTLGSASFAIDKLKTWPARGATMPTTGELYLWLRTNAGTCNVTAGGARLQWRDAPA